MFGRWLAKVGIPESTDTQMREPCARDDSTVRFSTSERRDFLVSIPTYIKQRQIKIPCHLKETTGEEKIHLSLGEG